jgi:hypothetical protein
MNKIMHHPKTCSLGVVKPRLQHHPHGDYLF